MCESGRCVSRGCVGVGCPEGTLCASGRCLPHRCGATPCAGGEVCHDGRCTDGACLGLSCRGANACAGAACRLPAAVWIAPAEAAVLPWAPVDFSWNPLAGADRYRLQIYRHDGSAWQSVAAPNDRLDVTGPQAAAVNLAGGGPGFLMAWLWGHDPDTGYGASAGRSFALFPNPVAATDLAPAGWGPAPADPPPLTWRAPTGTCGYAVTVFRWDSARGAWMAAAQKQSSDGTTSYTPPPLGAGLYYWTVVLGTPAAWGPPAGEGFQL